MGLLFFYCWQRNQSNLIVLTSCLRGFVIRALMFIEGPVYLLYIVAFAIFSSVSDKYKTSDLSKVYFVTLTTVGRVDAFARKEQKLLHC